MFIMKIIREKSNTGCYSPPPLKKNLIPRLEITVKTAGVGIGYLDGRKSG
jgi:hypothetical protein